MAEGEVGEGLGVSNGPLLAVDDVLEEPKSVLAGARALTISPAYSPRLLPGTSGAG